MKKRDSGICSELYIWNQCLSGTPGETGTRHLVDVLEEDMVREDIRKAKELSDFVIVCPHWGTENSYEISQEQRHWTDIFSDCGVDLVLGTHPHVVQPAELVQRADGQEMLVYYSLGNFVSNQESADNALGAMAQITLWKDESGVSIREYGGPAGCDPRIPGRRIYFLFPGSVYRGDGPGKSDSQYRGDLSPGREPEPLQGNLRKSCIGVGGVKAFLIYTDFSVEIIRIL